MRITLLLLLALLAGCNSLTADHKMDYAAMMASYNTLEVDCSGSCEGLRIRYTDPSARPQMPQDEWAGVANNLISTLGSVANGAVPFWAITRLAGNRYTNSHNIDSTHSPTVVNQPSPLIVRPETVRPDVVQPVIVEPRQW